jgi:type I restriction enzyme S subunit
MTFPRLRLADVCDINPRLPRNHGITDDTLVSFVPMAAVDELTGTIAAPQTRSFAEVKKGYTSFRETDVLFAKITPCMENGKAALAQSLVGGVGFGSTEFHVLRAGPQVLPEWLRYFVRREEFRREAKRNFTGTAGQQRVPTTFISDSEIPVPPLAEQRRIVDLLSRAEGIVRLRREAQKKAAEIIPALFLDMFGDPATNPKGWRTQSIDGLCNLVRGSSPRPQGDPKFFGGPVPRLMIADITRDGVYVTPRIDSLTEDGALKSRPMKAGEVVMAVSGAVGLPAILAIDACIHDGFVGFRALSPDVTPEFFYNYLIALRHVSQAQAVGATFQNLKTDQIRIWQVPIPGVERQRTFTRIAESARSVEGQQALATSQAEAAFHTLLARAFHLDTTPLLAQNEEGAVVG